MQAPQLAVEVLTRLDPIAGEWRRLAEETGTPPFVHPGWIRSWWSAFGRHDPYILVVRRRGRLVGVLPMRGKGGVLRSPTNVHTPVFGLVASDEQAAYALAEALFASGARQIGSSPLDATGTSLEVLCDAAAAAGYRSIVQPVIRAPYLPGATSLDAYKRSLSHNLRHDVERRLRRLCEAGAVSIEVTEGGERLDQLLDEGFTVEASGWKGVAGTAIASHASTRRFYRDVARWAAQLGWLRLAFLRFNGRPIAFQFDLESGRTYYSLKIGFDPEFERFSPGKLLAYAMVTRAIARKMDAYELLGTDEPWKYHWTTHVRDRVALSCFRRSPAGCVSWASQVYGRRFASHLPFARRVAAVLRD